MKNSTPLHLGEKIRQIRVAKGLSQENLAYAIGKSKSHMSRLERGESEFDDEMLEATKKYLGIEKSPLLPFELEMFRSRIWYWNELAHNHRWDEAKAVREELSHILDLPYERELTLLYKMIEARMLFKENDDPAVEERLSYVEGFLNEASTDVLYLYHRVKGTLLYSIDHKNAMKHFLLALEYNNNEQRPDVALLVLIGYTCTYAGKLLQATRYFERYIQEYRGDRTHALLCQAEHYLAICYAVSGELDEAKKLFESSLAKARNTRAKTLLGQALADMGYINARMGNYKAAHDFYNDALQYFQESSVLYVMALTLKAAYLIELNDYDACKSILDEAKTLAENNEELLIFIEATRHEMTLNDKQSTDYLETVAIPFYISRGGIDYLDAAVRLCDKLEAQYLKRGAARKADAIARISRDIYKRLIYGPEA